MSSLHLVKVLRAGLDGTVEAKLNRAFSALAGALCTHLATRTTATIESGNNWKEIATTIRKLEQPIDLSAACLESPDISARPERPVEIFNALGHMEVLLAAIELLAAAAPQLKSSVCAPTQQYTDSDEHSSDDGCSFESGEPRIADLQGEGFALEAYGGVNYRNNSKAALDFDQLRRIQAEAPDTRCFICIRREAIMGKTKELPNWQLTDRVSARCAKRHGGPWEINARIVGRWVTDDMAPYILLELSDFHGGSDAVQRG